MLARLYTDFKNISQAGVMFRLAKVKHSSLLVHSIIVEEKNKMTVYFDKSIAYAIANQMRTF